MKLPRPNSPDAGHVLQAGRRAALRRRGWICFVLFFAAVCALKWSTLDQPPVWDTAMGLFPAAIYLHETQFDYAGLLQQPTWADGGPNTHSISLVTGLTAVLMSITAGGSALLPVLHVVHFAVAAACLTGLFHFARPLFGAGLSLALSVTVLLCPLFLTQAGYLYLEMPLAACTVFALVGWSSGRLVQAAVWTALACWVKETGLIVAGTIVVAALVEARPWRERLFRAAAVSAVPLLLSGVTVAYVNPQAGNPFAAGYSDYVFVEFLKRLFYMPDLLGMLIVVLYAGIFRRRTIWDGLRIRNDVQDMAPAAILEMRNRSLSFLIVYMFVIFFLTVPLSGKTYPVLSRFYVQIVPFLLIAVSDTVARLFGRRVTLVLLAMLASFFVANRRGEFYPKEWDSFSLAERTGSYADFLAVQRMGIEAIARLPKEIPVFYGKPEHYMLSHPLMGYLPRKARIANGHCLLFEAPYNKGNLEDYPDHFYLLYSNRWHGGQIMGKLLQQAEAAEDRSVSEVAVFARGGFRARLMEIKAGAGTGSAMMEPPLSEVPRLEAQVH